MPSSVANEPPIPTVVAGLLCNQIITEKDTNKKSLIGLFDTVYAGKVPFLANICIYIRLTDGEGKYHFRFVLNHLESEKMVAEIEGDAEVPERLKFFDIAMKLPPIPMSFFGKHEFQIFANDVYIGRIILFAVQRKQE